MPIFALFSLYWCFVASYIRSSTSATYEFLWLFGCYLGRQRGSSLGVCVRTKMYQCTLFCSYTLKVTWMTCWSVCVCVESVEGFKCAPASRLCPPGSFGQTGGMWECACMRDRIVKTGSWGNCWVCLHSSAIKSTSSRCYWQKVLTDYRGTSKITHTSGFRCLLPIG